ncbi:MAG: poly(R)-hydroxyalkanoic acid synthase subunit PhaE [Burkholderiaceae bacterium]
MAQSSKPPPNPWFDQASNFMKSWGEQGQGLYQTWAENLKKQMPAAMVAPTGTVEGVQGQLAQMTEFFNKSMENWAALAQWPKDGATGIDANAFRKMFDPAEWSRAGSGGFDFALEHLTEGPTYATLWDLDRKLLSAQKLSQQRLQDIAAYQLIVQGAWNMVFERFMKALGDVSAAPLTSGRELLDLWIATANETLTEMHRTPRFLEAQRRMTRSSAEYRLQEREIAEVFCEMHHIPTRSEVDELQRTVIELRRELRALKGRTPSGAARVAKPAAKKTALPKRSNTTARSRRGGR